MAFGKMHLNHKVKSNLKMYGLSQKMHQGKLQKINSSLSYCYGILWNKKFLMVFYLSSQITEADCYL